MFNRLMSSLNTSILGMFGETVTIKRGEVADLPLSGIYDRRPVLADQGGNALSSEFEISVMLRDSDLSGRVLEPGADVVRVRGIDHAIYAVQPDGQGMTRLILQG